MIEGDTLKGEGEGDSNYGDVTLVTVGSSLPRKIALNYIQVAIYITKGLVRSNRFISSRI